MRSRHIAYDIESMSERSQSYNLQLYERLGELVEHVRRVRGYDRERVKILDVGCGRGDLLRLLSQKGYRRIYGVDFDERCVEMASPYGVVKRGEAGRLGESLKGESFEIMVLSHVLEHLEKPKAAMLDLKKHCKRDVVVAVPNLGNPFATPTKTVQRVTEGHLFGWNANHLRTFLECACGLRVVQWWPDRVYLPAYLRKLIPGERLAELVGTRLLPWLSPYHFGQSLICRAELP